MDSQSMMRLMWGGEGDDAAGASTSRVPAADESDDEDEEEAEDEEEDKEEDDDDVEDEDEDEDEDEEFSSDLDDFVVTEEEGMGGAAVKEFLRRCVCVHWILCREVFLACHHACCAAGGPKALMWNERTPKGRPRFMVMHASQHCLRPSELHRLWILV